MLFSSQASIVFHERVYKHKSDFCKTGREYAQSTYFVNIAATCHVVYRGEGGGGAYTHMYTYWSRLVALG